MTTNLTTGFAGSYDWPEEEARESVAHYRELMNDGESRDYICQLVIKDRQHWLTVFGSDDQGKTDMKRFAEVVNSLFAETINFYM